MLVSLNPFHDFLCIFISGVCDAGFEFNEAGSCVPCLRGYYKDSDPINQFDNCTKCDDGITTDTTGSTSVSECIYRELLSCFHYFIFSLDCFFVKSL